jgi:hypothetical protein
MLSRLKRTIERPEGDDPLVATEADETGPHS